MDSRVYLDLENALYVKLLKAWRPQSTRLFKEMVGLIAEAKFDKARDLAASISFKEVGAKNKEYIKYSLLACINFGAAMLKGDTKTFVSKGNHERMLNHITANFLTILDLNVTLRTREAAVKAINIAEGTYAETQKADTPRFVKEFVSFQKDGDAMLQLTSSLHSSRLSTWGFVAEAELLGISKYKLTAVLDGRTSEFCKAISGKTFSVADAKKAINEILMVENPEDVKVLQPWARQDKASMDKYRAMSEGELTKLNLHIPPFHPRCRTLLTRIGKEPRLKKPKVTEAQQKIPKYVSTQDTFKELGITMSAEDVKYWNDYMGVSPVTVLSKLSNTPPKTVIDLALKLKNSITINKAGDIIMKSKSLDAAKGVYNGTTVFDPLSGKLFKSYADLKASNSVVAATFLRELLTGVADVGTSIGSNYVVVNASSTTVSSFVSAGFLPTVGEWYELRLAMADNLADLEIPAGQKQFLQSLLDSKKEKALFAILNLDYKYNGVQVGQALLSGVKTELSLNLNDPVAMELFKGLSK